jgi:hypothetical protein
MSGDLQARFEEALRAESNADADTE